MNMGKPAAELIQEYLMLQVHQENLRDMRAYIVKNYPNYTAMIAAIDALTVEMEDARQQLTALIQLSTE